MISPSAFIDFLKDLGVNFYTGVPDSTLKHLCAYITDTADNRNHIIAANEGNAVAIASGYHLATGKIALVYMQNSGIGNAVNPLISIADREVYHLPMLIMIGWRGEPGAKDEPQHKKQGLITRELLEVLGIPYTVLDAAIDKAKKQCVEIIQKIKHDGIPGAIVIRKGTFDEYRPTGSDPQDFEITREEAMEFIINSLSNHEIIVSTTGMASRELYELRDKYNQGHETDFLTIGGMGHCSSIALGIALQKQNRQVIIIDGDGAALMHMGALAITGNCGLSNLKHILINNGSHESVGGQPTVGFIVSFSQLAGACGYGTLICVSKREELRSAINGLLKSKNPALLEIQVKKGSRKDLGRPKESPLENKLSFMKYLEQ